MADTISLISLGSFQEVLGTEPLPPFRTSKVQALLFYLAVEAVAAPGQEHQREAVMALLWPRLQLKSAHNNLRQTVFHLRQMLPTHTVR